MKQFKSLWIALLLLCPGWLAAQTVSQTPHGIKFTVPDGSYTCEVQFYTPSIVRVVKYPQAQLPEKPSPAVVLTPEDTRFRVTDADASVVLRSKALCVTVDKRTATLQFADADGRMLLTENGAVTFRPIEEGVDKGYFRVRQAFLLDPDETIYGLGQLQNGKMSQRNQEKYLIQSNVEDFSPFFQSVKGYGLYWDNYSPTTFADNSQSTSFDSEVGLCADYYFLYGGNADGVVAGMRTLTGQAPMFPLWTYGYWQSKERYKSQDETVGVVRKYRELGVPLDGIIQDWQYWGNNYLWNAMDFTNTQFPDPQRMLDEVHGLNAHMAISIWQSFGPATKPYRELAPKGLLYDFKTWPASGTESWPPNPEYPSGVRVYDAYSPEARDIYWKYLNEGIFKYGMDAWWMDSTEPDHLDFKPSDLDQKTYFGSFRRMRNAFPLYCVQGVYDHQRATTSDKRVFILTRSGYVGSQRYGANVWSGDIGSSWESLRNQVPAGLNFSLCGMPHWNNDIGGFFCGSYNKSWNDGFAPRNPLYQELYVRWLQFGTFTPMMRSHGADAPREIYQFGKKGEPVYDAIEKMIHLRYALLPYIYSTSWEVTHRQSTFMRALVMDFPDDRKVLDLNDEYMFGPAILVAPVLEAQYTPEKAVKVDEQSGWDRDNAGKAKDAVAATDFTQKKSTTLYLPPGATWYDFWTGETLKGGQDITRETTLDLIPLYVKAGSIVPFGPTVQYATEKPWDNLTLRIYPGADGSFTLYEDEFDNYNYEKGAYTEIPMTWDDSSRRLTIGARRGSYPGMLTKRQFTVRTPDGKEKTVTYTGKKVTVRL